MSEKRVADLYKSAENFLGAASICHHYGMEHSARFKDGVHTTKGNLEEAMAEVLISLNHLIEAGDVSADNIRQHILDRNKHPSELLSASP